MSETGFREQRAGTRINTLIFVLSRLAVPEDCDPF
jgi:hypothetical protein